MRIWSLLLPLIFLVGAGAHAESGHCTTEVAITDVIGPATLDLIGRTEKFAAAEGCESILLLINTPGGSLESTRKIVETILNSPYPYLCLVAPSGGHAGSAGAIILQACHVAGAVPGTNLGAATPVTMGGEMPEDLRKKILNDTRSWLESLTRLRGRSDKFGQDIILNAKAVTAEDALKLKAIDVVSPSRDEFLKFANGRKVTMAGDKKISVVVGPVKTFVLDMRYKVVSFLTDPQFAYMLLLGSLGLLYFEVTHPGTMIAGVVGGIGFVVAMVALQKLDVEWGGLALLLLGIVMLIAEMFVPSFGALGVGGIVAFIFGSIFLFDPVKTGGYTLPLSLILPLAALFAALFLGIGFLVLRTAKVRKKGGFEDLIGHKARVVKLEDGYETVGVIELRGEIWSFESSKPVAIHDLVVVFGYEGMVLKVEKETPHV